MKSSTVSPATDYTPGNTIKLIRGGNEYFTLLLKLIRQAKDSIHIQTYIFDDDETGTLVADALIQAANNHVKVYLLADGYASQVMSRSFIKNLRNSGIHFRFFEPIFKSRYFYFGRRLHHKIVVVDTKYALTGGVNIANRYNDLPGSPAWLDFAIFIEGDIARQLCILCWKTWKGFPKKMELTVCEINNSVTQTGRKGGSAVSIRRNDWVKHKNEISESYISMLRNAETEIILLCSYFLPGKVIRRQMQHAINRGVTIKVIAAGLSDVMLSKRAERWLYDWLLRKGIELYEYNKTVLHGKLAVCDNERMTIGSYNINDISAYASIELNLDIEDPHFVTGVRQLLDDIIVKDCIRITPENHIKTNNFLKQFLRWISYHFIRVVFHLFTFYFKQKP